MSARQRLARWLLRDQVPNRVNATHVRDLIHNELASTDNPDVEAALYRILNRVGEMEWTP